MSSERRVFFDVSYTRTQRGQVGITRTVRRLAEELRGLCVQRGEVFMPVAFHTNGFREAVSWLEDGDKAGSNSLNNSLGARVFRAVTGKLFRAFVLNFLRLPSVLVLAAWSLGSSLAFNLLSRSEPKISPNPGDVLLIFDAGWNYPIWRATRRARRSGAKVVFLIYDLIPEQFPQFCYALMPLLFKRWLNELLACSDGIVCISRTVQNDMKEYGDVRRLTLPPVGHFRLGADFAKRGGLVAEAIRSSLSSVCPSGNGTVCFAAVGSIEPRKNYTLLLDVFENLWRQGLDVTLVIAGRPNSECAALIDRMQQHPDLGQRFLVLLDASDSEVTYIYQHTRALVFPSLAEGFGLPLVEARSLGNLVIASDIPAFRELADAGVALFDPSDHAALERLIIEHARHDRRGDVAPMPPFGWKDSAQQCLALVDDLLSQAGGPEP